MAIMRKSWASLQIWFTKVFLKNSSKLHQGTTCKGVDLHFDESKMDKSCIKLYETIGGNKIKVIKLKGLSCDDLGIINIYALK
jgi:hypothetical protein